jgi:hypothetical protein
MSRVLVRAHLRVCPYGNSATGPIIKTQVIGLLTNHVSHIGGMVLMFKYLLNKMQDAASFIQRVAEMTGITDPASLEQIVQAGIDAGELSCCTIGNGKGARLFITNPSVKMTNQKTVSRLIRDIDGEIDERAASPKGQICSFELSDTFRNSVDYMSKIKFSPNHLILTVMKDLLEDGYWDATTDKMELLIIQEFSLYGTDPYNLPLFPDRRTRKYTRSGGIASYQGGDWHRAICDFATKLSFRPADIEFVLPKIEKEYAVSLANYQEILADPMGFVKTYTGKKPGCALRAAEVIREMVEDGESAYIFQQDQTNSGGGIYAYFNGDTSLGKLTNMLPSDEPQCLYNAATQWVAESGLLPDACENHEAATSRGTGKTFIVPMIYGAANIALTRAVVLDDPKRDSGIIFMDDAGLYIDGSLDHLPDRKFNSDHHEFLLDLGWDKAICVSSDMAKAYEVAIYGDGEKSTGLTTRLRPTMVAIKEAARNCADDDRCMTWTAPNGCKILNYKLVVDATDEGKANMSFINLVVDGKRHRVSLLPMLVVDSVTAAPPNAIHSVDASVIDFIACFFEMLAIELACIHDSIGTHICHARMVFPAMKMVYVNHIPQDFLDKEIFEPNGVKTLVERGWNPLPLEKFMETTDWMG